jgi:hypothetical protein
LEERSVLRLCYLFTHQHFFCLLTLSLFCSSFFCSSLLWLCLFTPLLFHLIVRSLTSKLPSAMGDWPCLWSHQYTRNICACLFAHSSQDGERRSPRRAEGDQHSWSLAGSSQHFLSMTSSWCISFIAWILSILDACKSNQNSCLMVATERIWLSWFSVLYWRCFADSRKHIQMQPNHTMLFVLAAPGCLPWQRENSPGSLAHSSHVFCDFTILHPIVYKSWPTWRTFLWPVSSPHNVKMCCTSTCIASGVWMILTSRMALH